MVGFLSEVLGAFCCGLDVLIGLLVGLLGVVVGFLMNGNAGALCLIDLLTNTGIGRDCSFLRGVQKL